MRDSTSDQKAQIFAVIDAAAKYYINGDYANVWKILHANRDIPSLRALILQQAKDLGWAGPQIG